MTIKIKTKVHCCFLVFLTIIAQSCESKSTKTAKNITNFESANIEEVNQIDIPEAKDARVDFTIENSGSMFGYVSSAGKFTNVVNRLAGDLDLSCKSINYSLRNGARIPIGNSLNDLGSTLTVKGMNVGNVLTSDINLMLNEALEKAKKGEIAVLISDGIYSIPGDPTSILASLQSLSMQTRNNFVKALQDADLITYMVKLNSNFDGRYYPACGGVNVINQKRPYYVWIIGHANQMQELFPDGYFENLPGFENIVKFIKLEEMAPNCGLVQYNPKGRSRYRNDLELSNVSLHHGEFSFSIAFDFSKQLLPNSYFDELDIYECNLDYSISSVVPFDNLSPDQQAGAQEPIKTHGATHVVTFEKTGAPWGEMEISILNKKPIWIDESSTTDDCAVVDTTKTFGLSYLIDGITKAYDKVNETPNLAEYRISIKQ
ncbi:hypothetical protein [Draconibacterium sediminis]|uniref:VWFA domain-containing protein n=1 Tax=Draconibacterium sediminis TaxID=1544798 RepID=A0A0D8JC31_9BACT|nr:hypothetical protein [Draconibacterium sediminis]KJF44269.1 hypothetical protein LH29_01770 [Draconibacterium sediminis]